MIQVMIAVQVMTVGVVLKIKQDGYNIINTVFLANNYGFDHVNPICWETMIFSSADQLDQKQWRYIKHQDAIRNHRFIVSIFESYKHVDNRKRFKELVHEFN
jgi:hypothetical protein